MIRRHAPQPLPLEVLYEDDDIMAVCKEAGVVVHPCYKHPDGSVFNALLWHLRGTGVHPHLLQRLDKDTSGVMLVSKTMKAHAVIVRAMRPGVTGGVQKEYVAVVHGAPAPPSGEIAMRLRRNPADSRRVLASETEGRESLTRYATLAHSTTCGLAVLRCNLVTGRMHQIRAHLAARGWPLVGDPVYGAGDRDGEFMARQALHAWRVSFRHPVSNAPVVVTAPFPPDIAALLERIGVGGLLTPGRPSIP
jgi:23S rRNA pseudouridine1911/1915/1917 synthase